MNKISDAKPITLLLIELNYHAEVLTDVCPLLAQRFNLILISTPKIWDKTGLSEELFEAVILKGKKQSVAGLFSANENQIRRADIVYFNTLERHFRFFYRYPFHCPTIVRVHNCNSSLFPWESIHLKASTAPRVGWHLIGKVVLERAWLYRRKMLEKADLVMLSSDAARDYAQTKLGLTSKIKIAGYSLPFSHFRPHCESPPPQPDRVVLALTGSVDPSRKDYGTLLRALGIISQKLEKPIRIIFLGGPRGDAGTEVLEKFKALQNAKIEIACASGYVAASEVEKQMENVHFLLAPIKVETQHRIHREVYGLTKISGVENDIINFRKPALVCRAYQLPDELAYVCEQYDDENELAARLLEWIHFSAYADKASNFQKINAYQPEEILGTFTSLCTELISVKRSQPREG